MSEPVSPADTIRREWWLIHYEDADRADEVFTDEAAARERYRQSLVAWNCTLFASESALLAVGERDKAEIERLEGALKESNQLRGVQAMSHEILARKNGELADAGERDRRQIAQLTEALERIAAPGPDLFQDDDRARGLLPPSLRGQNRPIFSDTLQAIARAVLADKEDAHGD